jgi:hypothetical protein
LSKRVTRGIDEIGRRSLYEVNPVTNIDQTEDQKKRVEDRKRWKEKLSDEVLEMHEHETSYINEYSNAKTNMK